MTVATTNSTQLFAGAQSALTYSFYSIPGHPEYINVTVKNSAGTETTLTYNADYTVTQATSGLGGTVHVIPSYSSDYTQLVWRVTSPAQESDYDDFNQFPADTLEKDLDRLMSIAQELQYDFNRAIKNTVANPTLVTLANIQNYQTSAATSALEAASHATTALTHSTAAAAAETAAVAAATAATTAQDTAVAAATASTTAQDAAVAAATSATTAQDAAIAAATSATTSQDAAVAAATSATTAQDNAIAAATASTAAQDAAIAAATSATTAQDNAIAAATSATTAQDNAIAAATSATTAQDNAIAAATASTAAQDVAVAAATTSTQQATTASTQATLAGNYATTASTASTDASNYATTASTAAVTASTQATLAGNYATTASTAATTASTQATLAGNYATTCSTIAAALPNAALEFIIDGGGEAITTGIKGDFEVPFSCTIATSTLLANTTGSIVIDIWSDALANYPPTDADSITASAVPSISTTTFSQDSTLAGWTTSIISGSTIRLNVDSATDISRVTLSLKVIRAN